MALNYDDIKGRTTYSKGGPSRSTPSETAEFARQSGGTGVPMGGAGPASFDKVSRPSALAGFSRQSGGAMQNLQGDGPTSFDRFNRGGSPATFERVAPPPMGFARTEQGRAPSPAQGFNNEPTSFERVAPQSALRQRPPGSGSFDVSAMRGPNAAVFQRQPGAPRPDQTPSGLAARIPDERGPNSIDPRVRAPAPNWGGEATQRPTAAAAPSKPASTMSGSETSVPGIMRIDRAGQSPLFTNLPPKQAVDQMAGMKSGGIQLSGWDAGKVNESLARANAIRGSASGSQDGPRFASIGGGGGYGGLRSPEETNAMFRQWDMDRAMKDPSLTRAQRDQMTELYLKPQQFALEERLGMMREGGAMARSQLEADNRLANTDLEGQYRVMDSDRRGEWGLRERDRMGEWGMAQQGLQNAGSLQNAQAGAAQRAESASFNSVMKALALVEDPDHRDDLMLQYLQSQRPPEQKKAEGGLIQHYAMGGPVQAPQPLPEINEYRDYALGAQKLGLPAVPFERFLSLRQGAQQVGQAAQAPQQPYGAMGFANGGPIPDPTAAAGKMVVDTDPNAPTDSIPAMIDGQQPAKLDSGEFVMPEDVVKFFGTDKLNKMIAQARAGQQTQE